MQKTAERFTLMRSIHAVARPALWGRRKPAECVLEKWYWLPRLVVGERGKPGIGYMLSLTDIRSTEVEKHTTMAQA